MLFSGNQRCITLISSRVPDRHVPDSPSAKAARYTVGTLQAGTSPLPESPTPAPQIAFLLSRYPAVSHTFFLKEILGLRERGIQICTASVNLPDRPTDSLPPLEAVEAAATFYIKKDGKVKLLRRILAIAFREPAVTWRGLRAAFQLGSWDGKARAFSIFYLAEALLVGDWMQRNRLSHLHVHFGGAVATVGMLTSKAWLIPWSITLHGPDEFFDQDAFYLRQKVESANFVICISDFCRSQVLRIAPALSESRLQVVRLGVDCQTLRPTARPGAEQSPSVNLAESAPPAVMHIVCTGRMVPAKGHQILLDAVAALRQSGILTTLTLIGDGPERRNLEDQSKRLKIDDCVRFLGALAHGPTLQQVAAADIFVLASFAEGLPVALMEAMALGIPCVSTTIAAIPEMIRDRQNGLLVPPSNIPALRDALELLAVDVDLRRALAVHARTTAETEYNLDRNLDQLASVWKLLLKQTRLAV